MLHNAQVLYLSPLGLGFLRVHAKSALKGYVTMLGDRTKLISCFGEISATDKWKEIGNDEKGAFIGETTKNPQKIAQELLVCCWSGSI